MKLHTYLNYGGNCAEAFRFYEKNLGGKILTMMTYADQPDPKNVPPGTEKWILYANMAIGETQLMGSDVPPERFHPMRSVYLSLAVDSSEEAERIFKLLDTPVEIVAPTGPRLTLPDSTSRIEFDHVWFAYKDQDWILRDVSFRIDPGETVAVVFAADEVGDQVVGQRCTPAGDQVLEVSVELIPRRKDRRAVIGDVPVEDLFDVVGPVAEELPVLGWGAQ